MTHPAGELSRRVLVVDDDQDVREAVSEVLAAHGYSVDQAGDGAEGLEVFRRERPEVVIADLEMPQMRGVELLRRVREIDASTTVVLMTGYATLDLAIQAMKDGAADFLVKPIRVAKLLSTVARPEPDGETEAVPAAASTPRSHSWLGSVAPDRGFAGVLEERSGAIVLYAGEVLDQGRHAKLTAVLGDDAIRGLAERVGSPERVLLVAGQAIGAALEGGRQEVAAGMARIAPDGRSVRAAAAGVEVWMVAAGGLSALVTEGRGRLLAAEDPGTAYPAEQADLAPGALVVLATPTLVQAIGGEGLGPWLLEHGRRGGAAVVAAARRIRDQAASPEKLAAAALVVIEVEAR